MRVADLARLWRRAAPASGPAGRERGGFAPYVEYLSLAQYVVRSSLADSSESENLSLRYLGARARAMAPLPAVAAELELVRRRGRVGDEA